jgi:hypothetical protein
MEQVGESEFFLTHPQPQITDVNLHFALVAISQAPISEQSEIAQNSYA